MLDFFVGPMPVGDFLNTFLPYDPVPTRFQRGCFNEVIGAKSELDTYFPFVSQTVVWATYASLILGVFPQVNTIQPLVPDLSFVDTHSRGDKKHSLLKPDVCVYFVGPKKRFKNHKRIDRCIMASLDIHIEFKWNDGDDPFVVPSKPKDEYFVVKTAIDTLGQISTYAAAQLAAQYRTHAFSILIVRDIARLIRWDREGAIVTEPIAYNDDPSLVRFLALYSQASPQLRGIDTTVSLATANEAETARKELELPDKTKMFKTSIPSGETNLTIVFPFPEIIPLRPACRATRACSAYNTDGKCVVFFKDSWRVNAPDTALEGTIYEHLQTAHVQFVPRCLAHGVVNHEAKQATQTKAHSERSWACKRMGEIMSHTHYRLVLDLVGKSLSTFTSSKQLVQAIHDVLIGRLLPIHDGPNNSLLSSS
jgi:Fungal protein kinase